MNNIITFILSLRFLISVLAILLVTNIFLSTRRLDRLNDHRKQDMELRKEQLKKDVYPPMKPFIIKDCTNLWNAKTQSRYILSDDTNEMERLYPRETNITIPKFHWDNVVILMLIHNNDDVTNLLQSHFDTWISSMPKELDILFVTDKSDNRTYHQIFPNAKNVLPTIHLYKSAAANNDGKKVKLKMIDSLKYIYAKFKNWNKKLQIVKIDTDTFIIPENLIKTLQDIHNKTYPYPTNFGRIDCQTYYGYNRCYTVGGSYGISKVGIGAFLQYYDNPNCYDCKRPILRKHNPMTDEDYFMSLTYQNATCLPSVHVSGMSIRLYKREYYFHGPEENEWDTTNRHITIHLVKSSIDFAMLQKFYYFDNGTLRDEYRL